MKKILLVFLLISSAVYSQTYNMQNGSFTTCSGTFYDSGGAAGTYSPNENYQITFCPSTPGNYIQLDFTLLDIEFPPFEILRIYEGTGTAGIEIPLPAGGCIASVASSHPTGCITVTFASDNIVEFNGWAATISCVSTPGGTTGGPSNAVCSGANPFCADAGPLEFPNISNADCVADAPPVVVANTCLGSAPNPSWYYVEIATAGILELLIEQTTGPGGTGSGLDVDFAIWGPFPNTTSACADFTLGNCTGDHNCSGNVVDCSYDDDAIENATIPNAQVGEIYMLLITNFDNTGAPGFITMTQTNAGAPGAGSTDCSIVCPSTAGTNPTCGASDGFITISGLDPSTAYTVNYLDDGTPVTISVTSNTTGQAVIPGLNAGNYTNITTNFPGCAAAFTSVTLSGASGPVLSNISSNTPVCSGNNAVFTLTGTPNATVTYNINSGGSQTVILNGAGTATVTVNGVTGNTTLNATLIANVATGCSSVLAISHTVSVSAAPTATINYTSATYCSTAAAQTVTLAGTGTFTGGTFTAVPAGLAINAASGTINPGSSTAGSYTITYTLPASGCATVPATTTVNITVAPTVNISYSSATFCATATPQSVTLTGTGAFFGGTYSVLPAGLTINGATGTITPGSSTPGNYAITYTIPASGGCAAVLTTTAVTIIAAPTASISYSSANFCSSAPIEPVILAGTTGGTFSASPTGLFIASNSGAITPSSSTAGTYTVTYTIPASGGCGVVSATTVITIGDPPTANISYGSATYCTTASTQNVILTGTGGFAGGTYASSPAGLMINTTTGEITPSTSTAGNYTITYTIPAGGACPAVVATTTVAITTAPTAAISYASLTYCTTSAPATITLTGTGAYTGGTYSSTPGGLTLNTATGEITPISSVQGTYTVTYTIAASSGCAAVAVSTIVNISLTPTATLSYASAIYCTTDTTQTVTLAGTGIFSGGTYTASPAGLTIDSTTGELTPSTSTAGNYTITYTIPAGGCATIPATTTVSITAAPTANISYASLTYCTTSAPATITLTGTGAYTGGTYSSTPGGLTINTATGEITPTSSVQGTYTVTYTIAASSGCAAVAVSTIVNISLTPTATLSYASAIYCTTDTTQTVTLAGTGIFSGGTYTASPAGLTIDSTTGRSRRRQVQRVIIP